METLIATSILFIVYVILVLIISRQYKKSLIKIDDEYKKDFNNLIEKYNSKMVDGYKQNAKLMDRISKLESEKNSLYQSKQRYKRKYLAIKDTISEFNRDGVISDLLLNQIRKEYQLHIKPKKQGKK